MAKPALSRSFNGRTYVRRAYGLSKGEARKIAKKIKTNELNASVRTTYFEDAAFGEDGRNAGYVVYSVTQ